MLDTTSPANRKFLAPSGWTPDRVARLKELLVVGYSATAIALDLGGVTRNAVCGKIDRLGLTGHQPRKQQPRRTARTANSDRRTTQRIKTLKVRAPANGGARVEESIVREEPPQPVEFLGIAFIDLDEQHCRFPRGEGRDIRFCGQPRKDERPYCWACCRIAYQPPRAHIERAYLPTGGSKIWAT